MPIVSLALPPTACVTDTGLFVGMLRADLRSILIEQKHCATPRIIQRRQDQGRNCESRKSECYMQRTPSELTNLPAVIASEVRLIGRRRSSCTPDMTRDDARTPRHAI
jgi:hypothetical protein